MTASALAGFATPWVIYALIFLLHRYLPAQIVTGYVEDENGRPLQYRINGLRVLLTSLAVYVVICSLGWLPWDWLYQNRWPSLCGAISIGLIYTLALVLPEPPVRTSWWVDVFLGRKINKIYPGHVDAKMLLYLIGAVMLALNVVSFATHHYLNLGIAFNPGVIVGAGLLLFFVVDYLVFERVHLYTYDLFAERLGFKLAWGCTAFYPFFYTIALWSTVHLPVSGMGAEPAWWIMCTLVFLAGWMIARGANMQKYSFKRFPDRAFLGRLQPQTLNLGNQQLLVSGFWGLSRHINYLGEVLMATGIAMASGHLDIIWVWLYPLYYIALLFPRERDDDARCQDKYGALWDRYKERVPRRIIPWIY